MVCLKVSSERMGVSHPRIRSGLVTMKISNIKVTKLEDWKTRTEVMRSLIVISSRPWKVKKERIPSLLMSCGEEEGNRESILLRMKKMKQV